MKVLVKICYTGCMNPDLPDYQSLKGEGLVLSEEDFAAVMSAVSQGINDAKNYLDPEGAITPKITVSNEIKEMGFSSINGMVNIPMTYLNLTAGNTTPVDYRDQLVCFVPDKFFVIFKFIYWLRIFGRESAIHYYQKIGNPKLFTRFPTSFPKTLSTKALLLSDFEVEARNIADLIALQNKENPIWKNVDSYFSEHFSEYYNKPIEHLSTLPKPSIPVSFELENIMT